MPKRAASAGRGRRRGLREPLLTYRPVFRRFAADVYEYSFSQTTAGRDLRSAFVVASEGDSDGHVRGVALGRANVHWTLTNSSHVGDPNEATIFRQAGDCLQRERLVSAPNAEGFRATYLAVDETTMYLVVPGTGIVTHAFTPDPAPTCA